MSETCGLPPQPAAVSDAFASIQVMGKQTTEKELDDKVVVEHIYKLSEDGTVTIIFKYEDGTEEVFDVLDPNSPGLLQEQSSQEGFPWKKILKIKKIKEALERRRQHSLCTRGDFSFEFRNNPSNDPAEGLVTGCISGLSCNNESAVATSVRVLTNEAGFGLEEYVAQFTNRWNVTASCELVPSSLFVSRGVTGDLGLGFLAISFLGLLPCGGLARPGRDIFASCGDNVKFQYIS